MSGNTTNEYVFFAGRRIARIDNSGNVYFYYADHLGTTRSITNSSGTTCYDAEFTPYGQEMVHTNTCAQNYKFTGYERDTETGLDYAMFRYYNPRLGRFLSADPLGGDSSDAQSLNRYAYVRNSPTNLVDPLGLHPHPVLNNDITPGINLEIYLFELLLTLAPEVVGYDLNVEGYMPGTDMPYGGYVPILDFRVFGAINGLLFWGEPDKDTQDQVTALKAKVAKLFDKPKCAALFGGEQNAVKQLDISRVYPPGTFSPSIPGSIPAYYNLVDHPHGAVYSSGDIFLGPMFFDQSIGAQETLLIHELRHQAYNTGEPPITSPAYKAHNRKENAGIVAACGTQMPTKP